jgi:DNA-binding Xre family transcriptional regulator
MDFLNYVPCMQERKIGATKSCQRLGMTLSNTGVIQGVNFTRLILLTLESWMSLLSAVF